MSSSAATACNLGALMVRLNRPLDRLDLAAQALEAVPQFAFRIRNVIQQVILRLIYYTGVEYISPG
ncbi:MAG: hypothetical protein WA807_14685 [Steroidobacteraceae bacterium]